jgi:hypothetical protein
MGRQRNFKDVRELNESNFETMLSSEDLNVLYESEEELDRKGGFQRIFPVEGKIDQYLKYFETDRYFNTLLWHWIRCTGGRFPPRYTKKKYQDLLLANQNEGKVSGI